MGVALAGPYMEIICILLQTPAPCHSIFLWAGCSSSSPQTVSKHWRHRCKSKIRI